MTHDAVVVGAGIVGLATGYALVRERPGIRVLVLDKEHQIAAHQSGHNSGVIHSGVYYRPGSLKATNCRTGYELLLRFLAEQDIPHEICGKIIVATRQAELPMLRTLRERGEGNGLAGLRELGPDELREHEPAVAGIAGLRVAQTGIVDYRRVCEARARRFCDLGGELGLGRRVTALSEHDGAVEVDTQTGAAVGRTLINCAGLHSDRVARMSAPDLDVRIIPFRGEYYRLRESRRNLVRNLIYPVPDPAFPFLGVHLTRTAWLEVDAGPNAVLALSREGYRFGDFNLRDLWETLSWPGFPRLAGRHLRHGLAELLRSLSRRRFVRALQRLVPAIQAEDLEPAPAGVRAQACDRRGRLLDDFYLVDRGRQIHVCNAPSPAATSSLAIGQAIAARVLSRLG